MIFSNIDPMTVLKLQAEAYREGAAKMKDLCAEILDEERSLTGQRLAKVIRDLPLPGNVEWPSIR
jgi:hypothetical protein